MRILIIRFSSIGDIVLTSPVVRCLKKQLPDCEIHFLTKKEFSGIVSANPYIHQVWEWDDSKAYALLADLKKLRFDYVADLHHNLRSLRVKLALGRPGNAFAKLNIEKFLLVRFKLNRLPDKHIVDRYLETVAPLGIVNDQQGLDFFIPPEAESFSPAFLPETHRNGYLALVAGALQGTKRMPADKLSELCGMIPYPMLVLGGKAEAELGQFLAKNHGHLVNLCGKLSLGQSARAIRLSQAVITHDTGLMHIAAAFRKPIVSIWGNTVPDFGMYPYLPFQNAQSFIHEVKHLSCRPCSKIGFEKCPKKHFNCMNLQDLNQIKLNLDAIIQSLRN